MSRRADRKTRIAALQAERRRLIHEHRAEETARAKIRHSVLGDGLTARAKAGDAHALRLCREIAGSVTSKPHRAAFEDWDDLLPAPRAQTTRRRRRVLRVVRRVVVRIGGRCRIRRGGSMVARRRMAARVIAVEVGAGPPRSVRLTLRSRVPVRAVTG